MLKVTDNYKEILIEGKIHKINTSDAWGVFEVEIDGQTVKVNVGDVIEFVVEGSGEIKKGTITKISGKKAKTKIQMIPFGMDCEEIRSVASIVDGSLVLIDNEESEEE